MSDDEAAATDRRERRESRRGERHVADTPAAVEAGRRARGHGEEPLPSFDDLTVPQVRERLTDLDAPAVRRVLAREREHRARRTLLPALHRAVRRS